MENNNQNDKTLSRREFLQKAGIVIGGAALASLVMSSACNTPETTTPDTTPGTTTPTTTEPTATTPTTTPPVSSTINTPTTSTTTKPPVSTTKTTTPTSTATSTTVVNANIFPIPGCSSSVALDRLYSKDHVWVLKLDNNIALMGMTDTFQVLADRINTMWFTDAGTTVVKDMAFGYIEADKLSCDLISPVTGKVLERNSSVMARPSLLNMDAFNAGWLLRVQLTKPEELAAMLAPKYYAYLESPSWTGPIPAMH